MAAQPEPTTGVWEFPGSEAHAASQPSALVLPLRLASAKGRPVIIEASGDRAGPARGIALGLVLGLALWVVIIRLAEPLFQ